MLDVSIWGAFIGGLIVFFSPCVLPIVPFYISYMAGAGLAGLKENGVIPSDIRRRALISSLFFSLGIITVFVLLGAAAFSISQVFRSFQTEFRWVAAFRGVYEQPTHLSSDDDAPTTRKKKSASQATVRADPPAKRVGGGHGGAVVLVARAPVRVVCHGERRRGV